LHFRKIQDPDKKNLIILGEAVFNKNFLDSLDYDSKGKLINIIGINISVFLFQIYCIIEEKF
jgi:hypothetical protein